MHDRIVDSVNVASDAALLSQNDIKRLSHKWSLKDPVRGLLSRDLPRDKPGPLALDHARAI